MLNLDVRELIYPLFFVMMKIIVTGSAGFIGKALCQELRKRAVEVIEIDRSTGQEASAIGEYLKDGDVVCVFHLAAQTSVFNDDLAQIRKDNIDTFMIVADECERYHVKLVNEKPFIIIPTG